MQYRQQGYIIPIDDLDGGKEILDLVDYDIRISKRFAENGKNISAAAVGYHGG